MSARPQKILQRLDGMFAGAGLTTGQGLMLPDITMPPRDINGNKKSMSLG
jgi:hypothetical protein